MGSSCVYPKKCKQPIKESYLLTGELEKTNEPYAIAKFAGIKMCENYNIQYKTDFKCLMPCNTYGPNDNYDLLTSHFYPALISKIHASARSSTYINSLKAFPLPHIVIFFLFLILQLCIFEINRELRKIYN